ncbi:MAG: NYN domain-containing protein [Candidatus Eisenbacteria bacterium]|uniref:NYN domain-containing protein n=1 Tax=Eiseniibacteriota bacterium TaxID=2212470 RepID=A0A938BMN9_UNCEI|nr:NYN domain-containing protein [Candidatus Eisenbacteria bacterium]
MLAATNGGGFVREAWKNRLWLIDGHNAIFALAPLSARQQAGERQEARRGLEGLVAPFARLLQRPLTIVYDGNALLPNPDAADSPNLRTVYSQPPEEADDRIVFLAAEALRRGGGVTVVSNDRRTLAPRLPAGARMIGVAEFVERCIDPLTLEPEEAGGRTEEPPEGDFGDLEAHFLERGEEIERTARGRARRLEQEARRLWEARVREGRRRDGATVPGELEGARGGSTGPPAEYRESDRRSRPAVAPPARREERGPASGGAPEAKAGPGRAEREAWKEAREVKRRRGERRQARRHAQRQAGGGKRSRRK